MTIRLLSPTLINQIAAGEVIERPAFAVKELVENAIDAKATHIEVVLQDGGKSYLSVTDNGIGMDKDELALCVERHATSKLPKNDLFDIRFLGFRGEALPSIGSVARLTITSRKKGSSETWCINVEGRHKNNIRPASLSEGTKIEVKDLFFATPARLKFLKSEQTERSYIKEVIDKLAMIYPHIMFSLSDEKRCIIKYFPTENILERIHAVLGKSFQDNAIPVHGIYEEIQLDGFISLPTYTRATSTNQYLFVNGRWIKDKMLFGCIKGAYQGLLGHEGHPVVVLFLTLPTHDIDANVHPSKSEVRFRDIACVRGLIVGTLKTALNESGHKTSTTIGIGALGHSTLSKPFIKQRQNINYRSIASSFDSQNLLELNEPFSAHVIKSSQQKEIQTIESFPPLGLARAQILNTYIISQTSESIIIIDQHAAHERLIYEKIRQSMKGKAEKQLLLIPQIVPLSEEETQRILGFKKDLEKMGFIIDSFGQDAVIVREIPAFFDKTDIVKLVQDICDTLKEYGRTIALEDKIQALCAKVACHGSVRAGRQLDAQEMNALLRQMEACGTSGQCIHGRPTYIELKISDIERLFGRK